MIGAGLREMKKSITSALGYEPLKPMRRSGGHRSTTAGCQLVPPTPVICARLIGIQQQPRNGFCSYSASLQAAPRVPFEALSAAEVIQSSALRY